MTSNRCFILAGGQSGSGRTEDAHVGHKWATLTYAPKQRLRDREKMARATMVVTWCQGE